MPQETRETAQAARTRVWHRLCARLEPVSHEHALSPLRLLVVEDRFDLRDALVTLLTAEGAVVTPVGTGREAVARAAAGAFDVVLTDLGLPDMDGMLVVRHVAALPSPPRIVVLSGEGGPLLERARAAGAHAVLRKPVAWSELIASLRAAPHAA